MLLSIPLKLIARNILLSLACALTFCSGSAFADSDDGFVIPEPSEIRRVLQLVFPLPPLRPIAASTFASIAAAPENSMISLPVQSVLSGQSEFSSVGVQDNLREFDFHYKITKAAGDSWNLTPGDGPGVKPTPWKDYLKDPKYLPEVVVFKDVAIVVDGNHEYLSRLFLLGPTEGVDLRALKFIKKKSYPMTFEDFKTSKKITEAQRSEVFGYRKDKKGEWIIHSWPEMLEAEGRTIARYFRGKLKVNSLSGKLEIGKNKYGKHLADRPLWLKIPDSPGLLAVLSAYGLVAAPDRIEIIIGEKVLETGVILDDVADTAPSKKTITKAFAGILELKSNDPYFGAGILVVPPEAWLANSKNIKRLQKSGFSEEEITALREAPLRFKDGSTDFIFGPLLKFNIFASTGSAESFVEPSPSGSENPPISCPMEAP